MSDVDDANAVGKQIIMSSLSFVDIYSKASVDLISIENLETSSDFEIFLSDIEASNVTFDSTGNLFNFQQQTISPLILRDCYFHDLTGVNIYLESFNLANQDLLTNVQMVNITAENIDSITKSFIVNNEGGYLEIYNSSFTNMQNVERGAVITGGYQNSQTFIYNSTFTNNTSVYGGVAYVHSGSVIKFFDCELTHNFAVQSGVIQVSDDGYFEIYDSTITNNHAYTVPISELFISSPTSMISNSVISSNEALSSEYILAQVASCTELCFFSDAFKEYLLNNPNLLNSKQILYSFQCISSNLNIVDNSVITNQPEFMNAYLSSVTITDSHIKDTYSETPLIIVTTTDIVMEGIIVTNLTTVDSGLFFSATLEADVDIVDLVYNSSQMMFLKSFSSSINLSFEAMDIDLTNHLIEFSDSYDTVIENTSISKINTTSSEVIHVSSSSITRIENMTMSDLSSAAFHAHDSKLKTIKSVRISGATKGMYFLRSKVSTLQDLSVTNCGTADSLYGGAIKLQDSDVSLSNSTFSNNTAHDGGAISVL